MLSRQLHNKGQEILERGADVLNMKDNGFQTLQKLIKSPKSADLISLLLNRYPHLITNDSPRNFKRFCPVPLLLEAVLLGFPETVEAILAAIKQFTEITDYARGVILSAIFS